MIISFREVFCIKEKIHLYLSTLKRYCNKLYWDCRECKLTFSGWPIARVTRTNKNTTRTRRYVCLWFAYWLDAIFVYSGKMWFIRLVQVHVWCIRVNVSASHCVASVKLIAIAGAPHCKGATKIVSTTNLHTLIRWFGALTKKTKRKCNQLVRVRSTFWMNRRI